MNDEKSKRKRDIARKTATDLMREAAAIQSGERPGDEITILFMQEAAFSIRRLALELETLKAWATEETADSAPPSDA
jgi:hypothetical protein